MTMRPTASMALPAANGTTAVMVRDGHVWASAGFVGAAESATAMANAAGRIERLNFIRVLPPKLLPHPEERASARVSARSAKRARPGPPILRDGLRPHHRMRRN